MHEVVTLKVPPKVEVGKHGKHSFMLRFEPSEPAERRWSWMASITQVYQYHGSAPNIDLARHRAKRQIDKVIRQEEIYDAQ